MGTGDLGLGSLSPWADVPDVTRERLCPAPAQRQLSASTAYSTAYPRSGFQGLQRHSVVFHADSISSTRYLPPLRYASIAGAAAALVGARGYVWEGVKYPLGTKPGLLQGYLGPAWVRELS